ncbi:MAG: CapA family protein, partial [Elusimicrobia bacterium]
PGPRPGPAVPPPPVVASTAPAGTPITVAAVGDIMLAHRAPPLLEAHGTGYPFEATREALSAADIAFGNLETPVSHRRGKPHPKKEYRFVTKPAHIAGLADAGFDLLSVANNHTGDFGPDVFLDTLGHVEKLKIKTVGGGRNTAAARAPALFVVRGTTVAFLAYSHTHPMEFHAGPKKPGTAFPTEAVVAADVAAARETAGRVIVSIHWGKEYQSTPTESQRALARAAATAGADAVIGHHPHTYQGVEAIGTVPVVYSLGNFAFGTRNPKAQHALFLQLAFPPEGPPDVKLRPLLVDAARVHFQPRFLEDDEGRRVIENVAALSAALETPLRVEGTVARWSVSLSTQVK